MEEEKDVGEEGGEGGGGMPRDLANGERHLDKNNKNQQ